MKLTTTGFMLTAALALPASMLPASSASAQVGVGVSVNFGPPPLPVYEQPELAGSRLSLDTGLLGLRPLRLLLGARRLGVAARGRTAVDARLLGLVRRRLPLVRRLLGSPRRLLRRHQLRLWLSGQRVLRRSLGSRPLLLQPCRSQGRPATGSVTPTAIPSNMKTGDRAPAITAARAVLSCVRRRNNRPGPANGIPVRRPSSQDNAKRP